MAKRDFIFIDESGDPGKKELSGSSDYYMLTALHVTDNSIRKLTEHFCRLRYFRGLNKELKNIYKDPVLLKIIFDIYSWIGESKEVFCTSGYIQKVNYTGPYLSKDRYGGYDPQKFRNYILRRVLERHFFLQGSLSTELEVVIDRVYPDYEMERDLLDYLEGNYNLPAILHLVQVDSRYVEGIQLCDLISRVIKAKCLDRWDNISEDDLKFAETICLNQIPKGFPDQIYKP